MPLFNRHGLMPFAVLLVMCVYAQPGRTAVVSSSIAFDLTSSDSNSGLVNAGNSFVFSDLSEFGIEVTATAWSGGDWDTLTPATVLSGGAGYEELGYNVANGVSGLGACNSQLKNCLKKADQFGINGKGSNTEWLLLTASSPLQFESLTITPTNNKKGKLVVYSGLVNNGSSQMQLVESNFTAKIEYDYKRLSGEQAVNLLPLIPGNALLINAQGGVSSFTVQGMSATIVPLPPAVFLMATALLGLSVHIRRRT